MSKKFSHVGQAFSQLGQAFMLPIAILPVAGLLLGLGGALTNKAAVGAYPWLNQEFCSYLHHKFRIDLMIKKRINL